MTIYNFDDKQLDFDFNSTKPPVFRIIVRPRERHFGAFAEAIFRGANNHPHSVTAWGATEGDTLEALLSELRERYTPKPNRVVIVTHRFDSLIEEIRAERPVVVIIRSLAPLGEDEVWQGQEIGQLNCVKEP